MRHKPDEPNQRKARAALVEMAEKDVPVEKRIFGEGGYLRPMFVQPYRCTNVLIEDITITNSPMWEIHPVLCRNVTVRNVTVVEPRPQQRRLRSRIERRRADRRLHLRYRRRLHRHQERPQRRRPPRCTRPRENIIVQNCTMKDGHGGVTMGSECSGDIRNVFAQDCQMDSPQPGPRAALQDQRRSAAA